MLHCEELWQNVVKLGIRRICNIEETKETLLN